MTIKTSMRSIGAFVSASAKFAMTAIGEACGASRPARWCSERDKNRRALAELDDDEVSSLSDMGRQVRSEARRPRQESRLWY